ncbi:hypothetical protein ACNKHK_06235 [Shigella flexneri]
MFSASHVKRWFALLTGMLLADHSCVLPVLLGEETCDMKNQETFYQAMRRQGVTRRKLSKYCSRLPRRWDQAREWHQDRLGAGEQTPHSGGMDPRSWTSPAY